MPKKKPREKIWKKRRQYGAIPVRIGKNGKAEVLLLTSRGRGRWGIPKGWPMPQRSPKNTARREAFEEAGLKGRIRTLPVGRYRYSKRLGNHPDMITVKVFILRVERQLRKWPEKPERKRRWFKPGDAAVRVRDRHLGWMLRRAARLAAAQL
jgi:8-oxo-dGTP pyrophosphatase MutT (NUDIX family)